MPPRERQKLQPRGIESLFDFDPIQMHSRKNTVQGRGEGAGGNNINNAGIMSAAMTNYSPDFKGRWLTQSPTGNKFFSYLVNRFGSEGSSDYLKDVIGEGGFPLWGGTFRPTLEKDKWGFNWSIGG